ncbi:crocetin glucosyltransferase, chloroplastic-like [Vitis riparia]|uniref:crocetin glucosyltransferase, chloroplastic-like n=1 Tax=Vitis riparia TaxID=96939 RepID=UPI00155B2CCC|nr:crocetin glucosyltransferase, chloroplastic-like [Vitis riparia]
MLHHHFLLITYPAQGHINPTLQFAKRLIRMGMEVTLVTGVSALSRMAKAPSSAGLTFTTFPDGYAEWDKARADFSHQLSEIKRSGSQALTDIILRSAEQGRPVTCLVHTLLLPWVTGVARRLHVPSALLWIQTATVLDIYYYYFNYYGDVVRKNSNDPSCSIELPGLPLLTCGDLPSFLLTDSISFSTFQEQVEVLTQETNPKVLVNTFNELEAEALRSVDKLKLIGIGPLIPSAFLDAKDPSDTSFGADIFHGSTDCIQWLNSKPKSSVIYVSFGTLCDLPKPQMDEIARALLDSGRPFLWVLRSQGSGNVKDKDQEEEKWNCREELEEKGMIVPWCSQLEVLSHPSSGCFVTHCGWNSTLEGLACGVPIVAFPQWSDQRTNAKLITEMWKTGVRALVNEEGIVESDEMKRCLEIVMEDGERAREMRRNAEKWKDLAREAVKEGGSSDRNLKAFVDEVVAERVEEMRRNANKPKDLEKETVKEGGISDKNLKVFVDEVPEGRGEETVRNAEKCKDLARQVVNQGGSSDKDHKAFVEEADGERVEELRSNTEKWKDLAAEAVNEAGYSDKNLGALVDKVAEEKVEEMRNGEKWKDLTREGMKDGAVSDKNLKALLDEVAAGRLEQFSMNGGFSHKNLKAFMDDIAAGEEQYN